MQRRFAIAALVFVFIGAGTLVPQKADAEESAAQESAAQESEAHENEAHENEAHENEAHENEAHGSETRGAEAPPAHAEHPRAPTDDPNGAEVIWRDGLRFLFNTEHGEVLIRFGGRLHFDSGFGFSELDDDSSGHAYEPRDEYRIRRARFDLRGSFFDTTSFRLQINLTGERITFADAFLGYEAGPGTITVGQKRAHFGFYNLMGSNDLLMMENSWTTQLFSPGRQLGVGYEMNFEENTVGLSLGFYRLSTGSGTTPNPSEWLAGGRIWASLLNDNEEKDLHLGGSFNHYIYNRDFDPDDDEDDNRITYGTRGAIRTAGGSSLLHRGVVPLDGASLFGGEAAFVWNELRIVSEFAGLLTNPSDAGEDNDFLWAISATLGYLVNGGKQRYSAGSGIFLNPRGGTPVGAGGIGLVEVVMHFDYGNLSDNAANGAGTQGLQVGLGATWYLNNNMRIMWNAALASVEDDGTYYLMGMRFQFNI